MEDANFLNNLVVVLIRICEETEKIKAIYSHLMNLEKKSSIMRLLTLEEELKWEKLKMNLKEVFNLLKENENLIEDLKNSFLNEKRG